MKRALRRLGLFRGGVPEDVMAKLVARDLAAALLVQSASERAVEPLPDTQGLAEVADTRAGTLRVVGLINRGERCEIGAKGVHALHHITVR